MQQDSLISLVISTYNRPDALEAAIRACFRQSDKNFEIIIADDGSTDNTKHCIERLQADAPVPLIHVWQADEGFRLAGVRNKGILAARGNYLIFLDGDCVPQRDFIARHRQIAAPGFMVTGSRILLSESLTKKTLADGTDLQALGLAEKIRHRLAGDVNKLLQLLARWPDIGRERKRFSWRRIKGCNLAAWRSDLERVNGFDESFTGWGHEDADFVVRLFNAGILRKDGAFATEVFHLWHREQARDEESSNKRLVLQRIADKTIRATRGLA